LFGVSHDKIEGGCRMILMEAKENPGHKISRQSCAGCETDNSRDFPIQIQFHQNPLELGKDMSKSFSELGSARSQSHALGRADEQGRFQISFQPSDVSGYRRLREMKPTSCFGDLANFRNYEKSLQ
jgi:hypothetical protein